MACLLYIHAHSLLVCVKKGCVYVGCACWDIIFLCLYLYLCLHLHVSKYVGVYVPVFMCVWTYTCLYACLGIMCCPPALC